MSTENPFTSVPEQEQPKKDLLEGAVIGHGGVVYSSEFSKNLKERAGRESFKSVEYFFRSQRYNQFKELADLLRDNPNDPATLEKAKQELEKQMDSWMPNRNNFKGRDAEEEYQQAIDKAQEKQAQLHELTALIDQRKAELKLIK